MMGFSMCPVPRVPRDANLGMPKDSVVQLFIFILILVYIVYSFIYNYFSKKFIFYINNF